MLIPNYQPSSCTMPIVSVRYSSSHPISIKKTSHTNTMAHRTHQVHSENCTSHSKFLVTAQSIKTHKNKTALRSSPAVQHRIAPASQQYQSSHRQETYLRIMNSYLHIMKSFSISHHAAVMKGVHKISSQRTKLLTLRVLIEHISTYNSMQIWPSVPFHAPTSPPYQKATEKDKETKRKQSGEEDMENCRNPLYLA